MKTRPRTLFVRVRDTKKTMQVVVHDEKAAREEITRAGHIILN